MAAHGVRPREHTGLRARAAYLGIRLGMTLPQAAGVRVSSELAADAGRRFGSLRANRRRVERACGHVALAFPALGEAERLDLVLRSYEHLFTLGVEMAFLSRLICQGGWVSNVELAPSVQQSIPRMLSGRPTMLITGHFGNWEVLGATVGRLGMPVHALYRPLDLRPLDAWVRRTRAAAGVTLVDKFGAGDVLPGLLEAGTPLGFVADQNAGDRGLFVPFFGRLTSTYKTIGLLGLRARAEFVIGGAHRVAPGRYRMEMADAFGPEHYEDAPDPLYYITARYRRAMERAIAHAPEQYLWMHRIWKSRPRHERLDRPFPHDLRDRLASLPWMDDASLGSLVERSDRDRRFLREHGVDRLP